jgi:2-methylisocitrate lyase-like PEP mutase family enzyme
MVSNGAHAARVVEFRRLHASGCFVMPNPWDAGSARALAAMGFPALATTSAGFAWSTGHPDNSGDLGLEATLAHLALIAGAVDLPVNADFQGAFARTSDEVFDHVGLAVGTGVAGLSLEDFSGDPAQPLLPLDVAVARVAAARAAIDDGGTGVVLTARSEGFVWGRPDLDETIRRLVAYAQAGADCLYAPFLTSIDDVAAVVRAVAPAPVNLVIHRPFTTVAEAAAVGVRRISVGGQLAKTAWRAFLGVAAQIAEHGTFEAFADLPDLNALLERP